MPRFIQAPPDPVRGVWLRYISQLQAERYRREQERAQEREEQKKRAIVGGGLALGAVGGLALAPALGAGAGLAGTGAGAGMGAVTPVVSGGTALTSALGGAAIGGRIGQQFAEGDYAGGVTTAASAAQGVMQSMDDQEVYGYSPSKQERALYTRQAMELGLSIPQLQADARGGGMPFPQAVQSATVMQADVEQLGDMASKFGVPMTGQQVYDAGQTYEGGTYALFSDVLETQVEQQAEQAGDKAFAQVMARGDAAAENAARLRHMEKLPDERDVSRYDQEQQDIRENVARGIITSEQGAEQLAALAPPRHVWRRRIKPRTVEEDEVVSTKTGKAYIRTDTGSFRPVGNVNEGDDPAAEILEHYQAVMGQLVPPEGYTLMDAAADYTEARRIGDQVERGTFGKDLPNWAQLGLGVPGAQAPTGAAPAGTPQPAGAAGKPRAAAQPAKPPPEQVIMQLGGNLKQLAEGLPKNVDEWPENVRADARKMAQELEAQLAAAYGTPDKIPTKLLNLLEEQGIIEWMLKLQ